MCALRLYRPLIRTDLGNDRGLSQGRRRSCTGVRRASGPLVSPQVAGGKCAGSDVVFEQRPRLLRAARPASEDCGRYPQPLALTARLLSRCLPSAPSCLDGGDSETGQPGTGRHSGRRPPAPSAPCQAVSSCGWRLLFLCSCPRWDLSAFTRSRFTRCAALQDAPLLPASSPALLDSEALRAAGPHRQGPSTSFILLQTASCAQGQSHSHAGQWLPGWFLEAPTRDRLGPSRCGQLAQGGPRAVERGPEPLRHVLFVSFVLQIRRPKKLLAQLLPNMGSHEPG